MLRARNKVEQLDFKNTHYIQKILSCLVSDKLQRNWSLFVVIIVLSVRSTFSGQICPLIFSFRLKKYRSLDICYPWWNCSLNRSTIICFVYKFVSRVYDLIFKHKILANISILRWDRFLSETICFSFQCSMNRVPN